MTAATVKSTKVAAALDASPRVVQDGRSNGGRLQVAIDTHPLVTAQTDEAGDKVLMLPLPSHAVLTSLMLYNGDIDTGGTSGAIDIGLHNGPEAFNDTDSGKTAYAAYGVIDVDCFASAITTLTGLNTAGVEVRFEASGTANGIDNAGDPLWKIAGLTSDPGRTFVVSLTITTGMTTHQDGDVTLVAQYANNG